MLKKLEISTQNTILSSIFKAFKGMYIVMSAISLQHTF